MHSAAEPPGVAESSGEKRAIKENGDQRHRGHDLLARHPEETGSDGDALPASRARRAVDGADKGEKREKKKERDEQLRALRDAGDRLGVQRMHRPKARDREREWKRRGGKALPQ